MTAIRPSRSPPLPEYNLNSRQTPVRRYAMERADRCPANADGRRLAWTRPVTLGHTAPGCAASPSSARVRAPTGRELLPRGDEELLLLHRPRRRPVFDRAVERSRAGSRRASGLDAFRLTRRDLELGRRCSGAPRRCDRRLHRALGPESPLFYLRARPLVQKLESVGRGGGERSLYRTDAKERRPEWPDPIGWSPDRSSARAKPRDRRCSCARGRDPLDGYAASDSSWKGITGARWTITRARSDRPSSRLGARLPVSASTATIGRLPRPTKSTIEWLCPPRRFPGRTRPGPGDAAPAHRLEGGSARDPAEWRGFTPLCSRVLSCPPRSADQRPSRRGQQRFERSSSARRRADLGLIEITEPDGGTPSSARRYGRGPAADPEPRSPAFHSGRRGPELIEAPRAQCSGDSRELEIRCARPAVRGVRDPRGARFARPNRDPEGKRPSGKRSQAPSGNPRRCTRAAQRSLREFCELRGLPEGIRGPETWSGPRRGRRRDPGRFWRRGGGAEVQVGIGRTEPSSSPAETRTRTRRQRGPARWKRSADGADSRAPKVLGPIDSEAPFLRRNGRPRAPEARATPPAERTRGAFRP
ncbi:hypothetical protein Q5P01_000674 [Channa striata]|uniref:Uncharacterized protein n=1 Tax=Channa striata TaxID=64152 RepID=A0AA88LMZ2_CHASR|nr:hypothetical protein Q5P01_000674 [Channa striata]